MGLTGAYGMLISIHHINSWTIIWVVNWIWIGINENNISPWSLTIRPVQPCLNQYKCYEHHCYFGLIGKSSYLILLWFNSLIQVL
jgi:hypothetical protein